MKQKYNPLYCINIKIKTCSHIRPYLYDWKGFLGKDFWIPRAVCLGKNEER